jgi:integrase
MFTAFSWGSLRRAGLVSRNPFTHDDIEKPHRTKSAALSLTIEQARTALLEIVKSKHCNALVFSLASGCRRGESCGLKWDAIDLEQLKAIIRESRYQVKDFVGQKCVKEERIREIPLNYTALQALLAERERQAQWRRQADDAWTESGFVFTDELGAPLSPMKLTNAFLRVARRAKLPTTRMHDLRHTAATFILSAAATRSRRARYLDTQTRR